MESQATWPRPTSKSEFEIYFLGQTWVLSKMVASSTISDQNETLWKWKRKYVQFSESILHGCNFEFGIQVMLIIFEIWMFQCKKWHDEIECKRIYFLNPFWYPDGLCFRNKPSAFLPPFLLSFMWIFFFFSKSVSFLFLSRSIVKTLPPKISR